MNISKILPVVAAALMLSAGGAHAQNFFERLFGLAPSRPAAPVQQAPAGPEGEEQPRVQAPPPQARPVALRVPTEDGVVGRDLKQNGSAGSLRIDRTPRADLRAKITIVGRRSAQSPETCSVALGGPDGVALTAIGRPDGLQRYQSEDPGCPFQLDVLDEAVLIKSSGEACTAQAASCQLDPSGLWGPDPSQLLPRARDYESIRASADKAARDNYKVLAQRARPEAVRPIIAEQAAFSSDRELVCRSYAREGSHSFCNARFSEGRAISLAQRLGVTYAAAAPPAPATAESRPPRRRDPYGVPPLDDLVQGRSNDN